MNLIFDIGANVGNFAEKCLNIISNCRVICVEPNNSLCDILKTKFYNKNVEILNYLVSNESNKHVDFYINKSDTISTASRDWIEQSRFSKNYSWNLPIKKETISIDDIIYLYGRPDLIKIDVEGYEYIVVQGLTKKQKELCFEWAEEEYDNINKTCKYLNSIGYLEFGFTYGDEYLKRPLTWSSWDKCDIHLDINTSRKEKWGMVWVK